MKLMEAGLEVNDVTDQEKFLFIQASKAKRKKYCEKMYLFC